MTQLVTSNVSALYASESPQVETPVIAELRGVSKYFGDLLAVGNVDLSISSGEFLSFWGRWAAVRQLCSVCLLALRHRRRALC